MQNESSRKRKSSSSSSSSSKRNGNGNKNNIINDDDDDPRPTAQDVGMVVRALCRQDRYDGGQSWNLARKILLDYATNCQDQDDQNQSDDQKDDQDQNHQIVPVEAYNDVLSSMEGRGGQRETMELLRLMENGMRYNNNHNHNHNNNHPKRRYHPLPTLSSYHNVLHVLGSGGRNGVEIALNLLLSMTKDDTITIVEPTADTYELVMSMILRKENQYMNNNMNNNSINNNYKQMKKRTSYSKQRNNAEFQWKGAIQILETMANRNVTATTVMYNRAISACANAREVRHAMSLISKMKDAKVPPDTVTYNSLISACAAVGQWKNALRLLDECENSNNNNNNNHNNNNNNNNNNRHNVRPDIITYTNAMKACARGKVPTRALALLEAVKKKKNLKLDAYVYTTVIDACGKSKMWRKALDLLDEMKESEIIPNAYTYSAAMAACGNGSQWERALELLNQMKEKNMRINIITYNSAITALAKASRNNARSSTRTSTGSSSSSSSSSLDEPRLHRRHVEFGGGVDKEQLWKRALALLKEIKDNGIQPDVYSYSSAISACGSAGRYEEAIDLIKMMRENGVQPNAIAYTGAISACARCGEWAPAMQLFIDMKADGIQCDVVAYNAIISALSNGNKAKMAYEFWNEMCGKGDDNVRNIQPDIITLTSVISCLNRSGSEKDLEIMDVAFADAVERQIVLRDDSMDTASEFDLSGMSLPVARATVRFILRRLLESDQTHCKENLILITGVGRNHNTSKRRIEDEGADPSTSANGGTTALREYVRQVLRDDFNPPIYSTVPKLAMGTIEVNKDIINNWMDSQRTTS